MAMVSGMIGIGGGIGFVLTGLLTNRNGDYHRVFWAATILTALAALAAAGAVQSSVAIAYAAMPALIIAEVPLTQTGIANSVNAIARSVGSSLASAVVTSLLTGHLIAGLPVAVPTESAFTASFAIGAAAGGLVLLVALLGLPRHRGRLVTESRVDTAAAKSAVATADAAADRG